jgi:hypothetical protein
MILSTCVRYVSKIAEALVLALSLNKTVATDTANMFIKSTAKFILIIDHTEPVSQI